MAEWKLELQTDVLNRRDVFYPSLRERTAEYMSFYLDGERRKGGGDTAPDLADRKNRETLREDRTGEAEKEILSPQYGLPCGGDDRKAETPFSTLLAIYGKNGSEYTFSRRGMRHMERKIPWQSHYHTHDYIEILYVIRGSFEQILLGERQRFTEGEVVITDRNLEHADYLSGEEDAAVLFLSMQSGYLDSLLASYDPNDSLQRFLFHALKRQRKEQSYLHLIPSDLTDLTEGQQPEGLRLPDGRVSGRRKGTERVMELLVAEDWNPAEGSGDIIRGALIRLLSILCQSYSMKLHSSDRESREKLFLYEMERYIRLMRGQVDATMLEESFHYHRNYFNRILQKYRGVTFREYTQNIRLDHAASLLASTSLPVREAAVRAGWNNSSHFYHLFEARFGMSPSDYRRQGGNRQGGSRQDGNRQDADRGKEA